MDGFDKVPLLELREHCLRAHQSEQTILDSVSKKLKSNIHALALTNSESEDHTSISTDDDLKCIDLECGEERGSHKIINQVWHNELSSLNKIASSHSNSEDTIPIIVIRKTRDTSLQCHPVLTGCHDPFTNMSHDECSINEASLPSTVRMKQVSGFDTEKQGDIIKDINSNLQVDADLHVPGNEEKLKSNLLPPANDLTAALPAAARVDPLDPLATSFHKLPEEKMIDSIEANAMKLIINEVSISGNPELKHKISPVESTAACKDNEPSVRPIAQAKSVHKKANSNENEKMSTVVSSTACLSISNGDKIVSIKQERSSEFHFKNADPPIFNECIKYYQGVCTQLTKEKDQLEEDKHHIKEDLCQLQVEIQDNVHAVKNLQDTMERLQLIKKRLRSTRQTNVLTSQKTTSTQLQDKKTPVKLTTRTTDSDSPAKILPVSKPKNEAIISHRDSDEVEALKTTVVIFERQLSDAMKRATKVQLELEMFKQRTSRVEREFHMAEEKNRREAMELKERAKQAEGQLSIVMRRAERAERLLQIAESDTHKLQESKRKLLSAEEELVQTRQTVVSIEKELIKARERAQVAEQTQSKAENRAEKAANDLCFCREEAMKIKAQLHSLTEEKESGKNELEMKVKLAEGRVSKNMNSANKLKQEVEILKDRAVIAEKELLHTVEKLKLMEKDLKSAEERATKAEDDFNLATKTAKTQNKDLQERADCAENKLVKVKKTMKTAEEQIEVFEQRIASAEGELSKVKIEAEEKIRKLKQQLQASEENTSKSEEKFAILQERVGNADRLLSKERDRADKAEKSLLTLKQVFKDNEEVFKNSLKKADKQSHDAIARALKVEKLLTETMEKSRCKETDIVETIKRIEEIQKVLCDTENKANRAEMSLKVAEKNHLACQAELQNKVDELNEVESQFKEMKEHLESTEKKFNETQATYQNEISDIQRAAYQLSSAFNSEVREKQDAKNKISLLQSKVSELASENAELKLNLRDGESYLSQQVKESKMAHASKQEMEVQVLEMRGKISTLEHRNSELRNQLELLSKITVKEDATDLETQQKIKALKNFVGKHHRQVKHLTKEVAHFEKEEQFLSISEKRARSSARGKPKIKSEKLHSSAKPKPPENPKSAAALEQHCDTIQNMMATFISSLQNAKENILLFDQPANMIHTPSCAAKFSKESPQQPPNENLKNTKEQHKLMSKSEKFSKLQNVRKWLGDDDSTVHIIGKITTPGQMEVSKVTNEICSKIERLGSHLRNFQEPVRLRTSTGCRWKTKQENLKVDLPSCGQNLRLDQGERHSQFLHYKQS